MADEQQRPPAPDENQYGAGAGESILNYILSKCGVTLEEVQAVAPRAVHTVKAITAGAETFARAMQQPMKR